MTEYALEVEMQRYYDEELRGTQLIGGLVLGTIGIGVLSFVASLWWILHRYPI